MVKAMLSGDNASQKHLQSRYQQLLGSLFPDRVANQEWIKVIDRSMVRSLGWGLSRYLSKRSPRPLLEGEIRYVGMARTPSGAPMKRMCIEKADKKTEFEMHRVFIGQSEVVPVCHICIDQGSIGWAGCMYLLTILRITVCPDLLHRVSNDFLLAIGKANLVPVRSAYKVLGKLRRGAWSSDSNHELLRHTAKEIFSKHSHGYSLFQTLLEELFREQGMELGQAQGDERQQIVLWKALDEELTTAPLGPEYKSSRWWSFECMGRFVCRRRWRLLLLLMHLGTMRKWWRLGCNPLLGQSSTEADSGDPIPGVDGAIWGKGVVCMCF